MWELGWWCAQVHEAGGSDRSMRLGLRPTTSPSLPKAVRNSRSSCGGRAWQPEGFAKPLFCQGVSLVVVQSLCWYL